MGKYSWPFRNLLNDKPDISLKKDDFIKEWKSILRIVIAGLEICGYNAGEIRGMSQLIEQYRSIDEDGILYSETGCLSDLSEQGLLAKVDK